MITTLLLQLQQCHREIARASQGTCVLACIGFLDWHAERIEILRELAQ